MRDGIRECLTRRRTLLLQGVLAFLATYGMCYLGEIAGLKNASFSVLGVLLFLVMAGLLERTGKDLAKLTDAKMKKRRIIFAAVVSFLFALSMIWGYQLQNTGMTDGGFRGKGLSILRACCLSIAVFPFGNVLFKWVEGIGSRPASRTVKWRSGAVFGICFGVIFICLIPVWLAYYPIIMSYDFHRQINEAYKGFAWFYPYQPIAHTWVIWVFLQLGKALGSLETGFACMALFQIVLYGLVTGYACTMVYRIAKKRWAVICSVLFFGVFPFNSVLVVCTTKDILFTIQFLLFFLLLLERSLFSAGKKKLWMEVLMVLEGCLMMQFRSNAIYAVAVFMVLFGILVPKKEKLRVLLLCVLLTAGGKVTGIAIKEAIGTEIGSAKIEMFSVPIQQMARVGYTHGNELDEITAHDLDSYIPWQSWKDYYAPLADTMKSCARTEKFEGNYGQLLSFWAKLGLQYPNEYLDAFLELTRGYWFLDDVSWAENLGLTLEDRRGVVFTYTSSEIEGYGPILHESKFPWLETQLEKIVSAGAFYDWPVVSVLFKSSFYTWSLFLVSLFFLYRKQKTPFRLSLLVNLYFGTMLLGPVVQIRYVFPIMVSLPLLFAMLLRKEDN